MTHVTYEIVEHDGGWAYKLGDVFSEAVPDPRRGGRRGAGSSPRSSARPARRRRSNTRTRRANGTRSARAATTARRSTSRRSARAPQAGACRCPSAPPSARRSGRRGSGCPAGRARPRGGTGPRRPACPSGGCRSSSRRRGRRASPRLRRQAVAVEREAVVHRDDLDLAGRVVLHRVVRAVVALRASSPSRRRAPGRASGGRGRCRRSARRRRRIDLDRRDGIFARRRRVARAVGQEHAVRLQRHDVLGARRRRQDRHLAAPLGEEAQDVALHAVVDAPRRGTARSPSRRP